MAEDNRKTENNQDQASRFEHKSQGIRTQSKNARIEKDKLAEEQAEREEAEFRKELSAKLAAVFKEDDGDTLRRAPQSQPKVTQVREEGAPLKASRPAQTVKKAPEVSQDRFEEAMKLSATEDTVIIRESDIPVYEIGLDEKEAYAPKEIRTGKVQKVTEDQFGELTAAGPIKKKTSKERKKEEKEQITPHQKLVRRIVWGSIWLAVLIIGFIFFRITYSVFYDVAVNPDSTTTYEYTVTAGATDASVYEDLTELGVIDCSQFIYNLRAMVFEAEYVEGTYELSDGYTTEKIINIMAGYDYSS